MLGTTCRCLDGNIIIIMRRNESKNKTWKFIILERFMYYMYIHLHGISAFTDWFTGSPPPPRKRHTIKYIFIWLVYYKYEWLLSRPENILYPVQKKNVYTQVLLFLHISFRRDEEVCMAKIIIRGKCTDERSKTMFIHY